MSDEYKPPLVSIIINNYNYGLYIEEAIQSALQQRYSPIEVIVVDDGSTDNSRDIIAKYADHPEQPVVPVLKANGGQASAFNAGIQASQGEIICFLDSDDIFEPQKVQEIVHVFESHPAINWCFHPLSYMESETGRVLSQYPPAPENPEQEIDFRSEINNQAKIPTWGPATSGLCFRRSLLQQILPMPEEIGISSDYYLRYAAVSLSKGFFLNHPLTTLRVHGKNAWTLQSNQVDRKARIFLLTGYWLRRNFPALKRMANKNFGMGLGMSWWARLADVELQNTIKAYFKSLSPIEKLDVMLRSSLHWGKTARQYRSLSQFKFPLEAKEKIQKSVAD